MTVFWMCLFLLKKIIIHRHNKRLLNSKNSGRKKQKKTLEK